MSTVTTAEPSGLDKWLGFTLDLANVYGDTEVQKAKVKESAIQQEMQRRAATYEAQDTDTQAVNPKAQANLAAGEQWVKGVDNRHLMLAGGLIFAFWVAGRVSA